MATIVDDEAHCRLGSASGAPDAGTSLVARLVRVAERTDVDCLIQQVCAVVADSLGVDGCEFSTGTRPAGRHVLSVPVWRGDRLVGRLSLWRALGPVELTDDERLALDTAAAVVGLAVANRSVEAAVFDERDRIGQALHDSVGQTVAGLGLHLSAWLDEAGDDGERARVESLLGLTQRADHELRAAVDDLLFSRSSRRSLEQALGELCDGLAASSGIAVAYAVRGRPIPLPAAVEESVLRTVGEALANVERHAQAASASVEFVYDGDAVRFSVRDDGVGFSDWRVPPDRAHFGLRLMRRRVEAAGGTLVVKQVRPHGVVVQAVIPGRKVTAHATGTGGPD